MRALLLALLVLAIPLVAAPVADARLNVPCVTSDCPVGPVCLPGQYCCRYPEPCPPPPD